MQTTMQIEINTLDPVPIYEQVRNRVVLAIASGQILPGDKLPSARKLAADLGINFHTVNKSYGVLENEGYVIMDRRKGAVVAEKAESVEAEAHKKSLKEKLYMAAAESVCHNVSLEEFVSLCVAQYKKAAKK